VFAVGKCSLVQHINVTVVIIIIMLSEKKLVAICGICYLVGTLWFLLFPFINITSGELKPRGIFVDEHALLTTSIPFEKVRHLKNSHTIRNESEMLLFLESNGIIIETTVHRQGTLHSMLIEPRNSPSGGELSVVIFKICGHQYPQWTLDAIISLFSHLWSSRWMSKSVLALVVSDEHNVYSDSLGEWLANYHSTKLSPLSRGHNTSNPIYQGLIRDALVLDLVPCVPDDSNQPISSSSTAHASLSADTSVTGFQGYEMAFTGHNGQLPNMDVISSLLSMQSPHISLRHHKNIAAVVGGIGDAIRLVIGGHVGSDGYIGRLQGLISFCYGLIKGQDGLHGHFLSHNIDAMTIKPVFTPTTTTQQGKRQRIMKDKLPMEHFLSVVISILRVHSNLHGKTFACHST
jgi:hypothetical protein